MILLDQKKHPNLFPLFQKEEIIALYKLRSISFELLSILGMKDNAVDFSYLNDQKGRAVIIPQVKSLPAFMEQARRMR
jgi:hypothetical protein